MIEPFDPEAEAADEALWDEQFAQSKDVLIGMANEAHKEFLAGLTENLDPDDNDLFDCA